MRTPSFCVVLLLSAAAVLAERPNCQAQSAEKQARTVFESGLQFLANGKHQEALKDFQAVVNQYPATAVADDALLQVAQYELQVARNPQGAEEAAELLLKNYKDGDSAPMAHVILGQVAMMKGRTQEDIDSALGSFERVDRFYQRSDAVPAALYYMGEVLRLVERNKEAMLRYREVIGRYPRSIWSARAHIGFATTLTRAGLASRAIEELQRVRVQFPDEPEAIRAAALITILYRLYMLPAMGQSPFSVSGRTVGAKLKDVIALSMGPSDDPAVVTGTGVQFYDRAGKVKGSISLTPCYGMFVSSTGVPVLVGKGLLRIDPAISIPLAAPKPDNTMRPLEQIRAAATLSTGDVLVADANTKSVMQFTASGRFVSTFRALDARRLAASALDHVAALPRESPSIVITDRDRRILQHIVTRGPNYELKNPVDMVFDAFGHLYVLDRDNAAVFVFTPGGELVTSFSIPDKTPGAFRRATAMTIDSAGRLFIFDERTENVQIYQ